MRWIWTGLAAQTLFGCVDEPPRPADLNRVHEVRPGTSTLAIDASGFVYSTNHDAGTLSKLNPETGEQVEVDVGAESSRLAVLSDHILDGLGRRPQMSL